MIISMSWSWPFPSTPARPRISPAWISRLMLWRVSRPVRSLRLASFTTKTFSSRGFVVAGRGAGSSPPIMYSANSFLLVLPGTSSATVVPRRITEMLSAIAITSSSLCEMKIMVRPLAVSTFRFLKSSSTSCGTSTAVGSSRIKIFAPRKSTFAISTRWRNPTPRSATRSSGLISRPYVLIISCKCARALA